MGYTTRFTGSFKLNKKMNDLTFFDILQEWHDGNEKVALPHEVKNIPDGYCQWVLDKIRMELKWDGREKFYEYTEWLRCVIELLTPAGFILNGKVEYQGEEIGDHGWIEVTNNHIKMLKIEDRIIECPHCRRQFHWKEDGE